MNPIPVLGIPHYNRPDLTARCIASIDYPVEKLVIINNRTVSLLDSEVDKAVLGNQAIEEHSYHLIELCMNAGVAGAWNEIIKLFPASWWLIVNNDIAFAPGDLAKMAEFVQAQLDTPRWHDKPADMIYGNHGASWFAITAHGVATAGLFDENIYPAYLEDCDMSRRFDLLGLRRCDVPDVHAKHGDDEFSGSCTIMSDVDARAMNALTHGRNFDYYRAKWGGNNEQETFPTPFNDPNWPVWAWRFDPAFRAGNQW